MSEHGGFSSRGDESPRSVEDSSSHGSALLRSVPGTPKTFRTDSVKSARTPASSVRSIALRGDIQVRPDILAQVRALGSMPGSPGGSSRGDSSSFASSRSYRTGTTGTSERYEIADNPVIWGTDIVISKAMESFREFLHTFAIDTENNFVNAVNADIEPHYMRILREMVSSEGSSSSSLALDAYHIFRWGEEGEKLYNQLQRYPTEIIPIMDIVLIQEHESMRRALHSSRISSLHQSEGMDSRGRAIKTRVFNLAECKRVRDLEPPDIDTLISIQGMVTRTSSVIPDMKRAYYRCAVCGAGEEVEVDRGNVEEPHTCSACGEKKSMSLIHNRSGFVDKQYIKLQETPESIPEGETPHTVLLYAFDELVDGVVPGDRVQITGIYRALPIRPNPRQRTNRAVFKTYIDVIHYQKSDKGRMSAEDPTVGSDASEDPEFAVENKEVYSAFTSADAIARRARVEAMAADPELYQNLATSLAPSIWELDDMKKGVLLQLFGGCVKDLGRQGKIRGEINILLVGDPGVAKSQLLGYVHKVAARGIYTSGKGSSAVGLTASITKDPETQEPVLESGALVLSDRGVCCIDEFDKMSDMTRVILHEVMEQQTVSIAKAGIIATLNARTSILAAANPIESRYNPKLSVVENIQLPPTLLSRFDLIYLVLDPERAEADRNLAIHLVALYQSPEERAAAANTIPYSAAQVMEYISYARAHCMPAISDQAKEVIWRGYVEMRKAGMRGSKKTITATTRQLESIIRLSEAHARMRLSKTVGEEDVREAIRLINVATQKAAMDPRTGTINMDLLTTGHTAEDRDAVNFLVGHLRDMLAARPRGYTTSVGQLVKDIAGMTEMAITSDDVLEALRELEGDEEPLVKMQGSSKVTVVA